ncbi:MAG TPA: hypothetical protein VGM38_08750 [Pseudolysinimonas sp.]
MRPSDWFLVDLGGDPTPGDAFGIRALAGKYGEIAQIAGEASTGVRHARSSGATSAWVGDAGDVFRDKSERMPGELAKANDSYDLVADALRTWATAVDDTQAQADRGLQQAREAQADLNRAHAALNSAEWSWTTAHAQQLTYQTLKKAYTAVPPPPGVTMPTDYQLRSVDRSAQQAQTSIASAQHAIADADARLAAAKSLVASAKERRDDVERTIVHRIAQAGDHAVKPSSIWEAIQDSAAWQAIVVIATVALAIITIVAIFVGGPLVWAIIIAATVLLMVNALMSIAQGKDAWGELALLAIALIPGGRLVELVGGALRAAVAGVRGLNIAVHIGEAIDRAGAGISRAAQGITDGIGTIRDGVGALTASLHTVTTTVSAGEHALGPEWDRVATLFNKQVFDDIVASATPSFGKIGGLAWAMPAEDAMRILNPADAARQSGMADLVAQAARNGDDIFALFSNSEHMALRDATPLDQGINPNYLEGSGHTAIGGDGFFLVNATREMVTPGTLLAADAVIARLEQLGSSSTWIWRVVKTFPGL